MSYILDALNKSEQERQHQRLPNLKTSHVPLTSHSEHHPLLTLLVGMLVALLLAAIGFGFWYFNITTKVGPAPVATSNPSTTTVSANQPSPALNNLEVAAPAVEETQSPVSTLATKATTTQLYEPVIEPEQTGFTVLPGEEVIVPQAISPKSQSSEFESKPIPDIVDLPPAIQDKIPGLTFSTHIYASEPGWRMVGINGKSRRQGDTISNSLRLVEITEEGVILEYDHHIFSMSVLRNWSGR